MRVAAVIAFAVAAAPAFAQERTPAERQTLGELAAALGEAHAFRVLCEGRSDQTWRNRMARVTELEQAEEAFAHRLVDRFNQAYEYRLARHTACDAGARTEMRAVARRGRDLASALAGGPMEAASAR